MVENKMFWTFPCLFSFVYATFLLLTLVFSGRIIASTAGYPACNFNNCSQSGIQCSIGFKPECDAAADWPTPMPEDVAAVQPPRLTDVSVSHLLYSPTNTTFPSLNISWSIEGYTSLINTWAARGYSSYSPRGVMVTVRGVSTMTHPEVSDSWYSNESNTVCRLFDFHDSTITLPLTFTYPCFTSLEPSQVHHIAVYNVTLTDLPSHRSVVYYVKLFAHSMPLTTPWISALAIGYISSQKSIHVIFQRPPVLSNSTVIILFGGQHEKLFDLNPGENTVQYHVKKTGNYSAKLIFHDCDSCENVSSHHIIVPQSEFTKSTIAPTTQHQNIGDESGENPTPSTQSGVNIVGPVIEPVSPDDFNNTLKIILGTVFGILSGIILFTIVICMYRHSHRYPDDTTDGNDYEQLDLKTCTSVFLLYSYDCPEHVKVMEHLADYLMKVCKCIVHLDVFEEAIIQNQGLDAWLQDRIENSSFIIVVCSIGARVKCSSGKVKFKNDRPLEDYFAVSVDYIAERIRTERADGGSLKKYIVAYMEYSSVSDIPHQLDVVSKYKLMDDIAKLYRHVCERENGSLKSDVVNYRKDSKGKMLLNAMITADEVYKDGLESRMECEQPSPPPPRKKSRRGETKSEQALLGYNGSNGNNTDKTDKIPYIPEINMTCDINSEGLKHRETSLPSLINQTSLSPLKKQTTSRSFDSITCNNKGWNELNDSISDYNSPKLSPTLKHESGQQYDSDNFPSSPKHCVHSLSMPVISHKLHGSHTVLEAEIHNEWHHHHGIHHDREWTTGGSHTSASSTTSDSDQSELQLQRDVISIMNYPANLEHLSCKARWCAPQRQTLYPKGAYYV